MTHNTDGKEQFTGLVLLTGVDKPGISAALFETLAPFAISIIDVEQIVISDRLILTVLIGLNPAHQKAIEEDLEQCAATNNVDIATLFENRQLFPVKDGLVEVVISAIKLHPETLASISGALRDIGANIESITRYQGSTTTISLTVSNSNKYSVEVSLSTLTFEDESSISIQARS
jgi:phosphoserine phosphatase